MRGLPGLGFPCVLALLFLLACGTGEEDSSGVAGGLSTAPHRERAHATGLKIALIGIDGGSFDVLDPLVDEGRLPEFEQLIEAGVRAPLRSLQPSNSAAVWTTIATGQFPDVHGILDFHLPRNGERTRTLVTTRDRKSLALWSILGPFGRSIGVVGWWVSWPAEPVRGFIVSDRVAHSRSQSWADGKQTTHLTYPPGLYGRIEPLVIDPRDPPLDDLARVAELTPDEVEVMLSVESPVLFHGLSVLNSGYCEQRTYEEIAFDLLQRETPDLLLLLLIANDPISHTFWHFYEPSAFREPVDPERARRLGDVIPNMYRHNDRTLARLRERLGPDTVLFVVSDHGFGPSGRLPKPSSWVAFRPGQRTRVERPLNLGQSGSHRRDGMLIAAGGPIVPGAIPFVKPQVVDIAPTLLALLGLPVARDMPGRVLEELVEPGFWDRYPIRYLESYEDLVDVAPIRDAAASPDKARLEYLRALGYID